MKPAKTATTATRPIPRAVLVIIVPSVSARDLKKVKAATNKLLKAPTSAASMTLRPTQKPASAKRIHRMRQGVSWLLAATSAIARKLKPMAISTEATPQQAPAKNVEFKIAATAPRMAAKSDSFKVRKKTKAPMPKIKSARGAKIFPKPTAPNAHRNSDVKS